MQEITIMQGEKQEIKKAALILNEAKAYLKSQNIDQWQDKNGYPNEVDLSEDLKNGAFFTVKISGEIAATFMACVTVDETYIKKPHSGRWLTSGTKYGVLHRIAVANRFKGQGIAGEIANFACNYCKAQGAKSLRSDTHMQNLSMQRMLEKSGFIKCGEITLPSGAQRIIFEKVF